MDHSKILAHVMSQAPTPEIGEKVGAALIRLIEDDGHLLKVDASERAITHKLAMHLSPYFTNYNIDCEYNRNNHDKIKRLNLNNNLKSDTATDDSAAVYPDIIIHKRGKPDNLLVIEVKKTAAFSSIERDIHKLREFTRQMRYQYAVFINLKCKAEDYGLEDVKWVLL